MKKRFRSRILLTPEHPEADPQHIVRGVVRCGLKPAEKVTPEQRAELERRLDAYEADGDPGRPAEQVIADIRKKLEPSNEPK